MRTAIRKRKTVITNTTDYIEKPKRLLNDTTIYRLLDTGSIAKVETKVNKTLKKCQDMQEMLEDESWYL